MSRIVGIDLGTTNSLVAYVEGGIPRVIPDAEGRSLLPSIVAWTPNGVVVGEAARRQLEDLVPVWAVYALLGGVMYMMARRAGSPAGRGHFVWDMEVGVWR